MFRRHRLGVVTTVDEAKDHLRANPGLKPPVMTIHREPLMPQPTTASAKAIISREIHRLWQSGDMTARRANNALDSIGYDRRYSETEEDLQEAAAIARATLNELQEGAMTKHDGDQRREHWTESDGAESFEWPDPHYPEGGRKVDLGTLVIPNGMYFTPAQLVRMARATNGMPVRHGDVTITVDKGSYHEEEDGE
jgi:hypothetical protein